MPKIGGALKRAVEHRPGDIRDGSRRARPSSALMNPNRRKIFQHLCQAPCSRLGPVARATGMSRSSAKWHLEMLSRSGYVRAFTLGREPHYCPQGLIPGSYLPLFAVLARENNKAVYRAVVSAPGSDAGMLSVSTGLALSRVRACLGVLNQVELITRTVDGRHVRFFPTGMYNEAAREAHVARGRFVAELLRKLSSEHLAPEMGDLKGPDITITISLPGKNEVIVIPQLKTHSG